MLTDEQIRIWRSARRVFDLPHGEFLARVESGWVRMRAEKVYEIEGEGFDEVTGLSLGPSKYTTTDEREDALPSLGPSLARILADALDGRLG